MQNTEIPVPRASYRLQFRREFGFDDAARIAPYLARLGVSHVYASPYLKARPGSTHGYDIVDHTQLNTELGDEFAFRRMVAAFEENGLRQILDIVPNHMGVGGADNPWWLDVLEWGQDSEFAGWFDIDWDPGRRYLTGKLLVPFLGDQYGAVLQSGQLELRFEAATGGFAVWAYGAHKLPICPLHYARILGHAHPVLERLGDAFSNLPISRPHIPRRAAELRAELAAQAAADPELRAALEAAVAALNGAPGEPGSWRALDALIQDQHWRPAYFRVAADDINYRRFFDVNELAGLRMELPELFTHAHRLVFALLADGTLDGLRIDHVDGLLDPRAYLQRLRATAPRPFYLVIEKILARHKSLREDWPVEGTTGYEFANLLLGALVDPAGEEGMTRHYRDFTGSMAGFEAVVRDCKLRIMRNEMASELDVLARDAGRVARQNPRTADFTHNILRRGLTEVIAGFPVYRSYVDDSAPATETDRRDIDWAMAQARQHGTELDPSVFDLLHAMLTGDLVAAPGSGFSREVVLRLAMRVQQYSGPVMAKGLEDTAFYRYNRFVALNEVGGHPDHFGVSLPAFHRANALRARHWPHAMLCTATHDAKRGEDVRARLAVLSEMPEEWARQVQTWSRILRARRGDVEGTAPPDRNDEFLLYQLLLGAWPAELTGVAGPLDPGAVQDFAARLEGAMVKSLREAKLRSSWASPNQGYEEAVGAFIRDALDTGRPEGFLASFLPFQERVARLGVSNGLVQTALRLTLPGMPDTYQGTELWDLSLVDPDNRRPVDYPARGRLLERVQGSLDEDRAAAMREFAAGWQDGAIKLAVTITLLGHRRDNPALYSAGGHQPLAVQGADAERVIGFAREAAGKTIMVAAARFPARGDIVGAAVTLPQGAAGRWRDLLTGQVVQGADGELSAGEALRTLPVAVMELQEDG